MGPALAGANLRTSKGLVMVNAIEKKAYAAMGGAHAGIVSARRGALGALKGQTLIEYAVLGALLAVGLVAATILLRGQINNVFNAISNALARGMSLGNVH